MSAIARARIALGSMTAIAAFASQPFVALAAEATPTEKDAQSASRVVKLSEKLRCLVCQNQSIADSSADLAQDLRRQIRDQVAAGKTDDEIVAYMVARYGDFVLYEPPVKPTTVLLWAGPALLLVAGFTGLAVLVRARRAEPEAPPLTAEERERAAKLLEDKDKDNPE
jgi:cytochrome c-type biogenesis protein CcmH